jgi:hypothetical protein
MASLTVTPESFSFVEFTNDEIVAAADHVRSQVGLEDRELHIDVNEESPLARVELTSLDPISLTVEGGAFEDPKKPRHLSPVLTQLVVGTRLLQAADRLDADFGAPGLEVEVNTRLQTVWDVYSVARLARGGHPAHQQRWRYHWRNRHGFTDQADQQFDRVWTTEGLTWADLVDASDAGRSEDR